MSCGSSSNHIGHLPLYLHPGELKEIPGKARLSPTERPNPSRGYRGGFRALSGLVEAPGTTLAIRCRTCGAEAASCCCPDELVRLGDAGPDYDEFLFTLDAIGNHVVLLAICGVLSKLTRMRIAAQVRASRACAPPR